MNGDPGLEARSPAGTVRIIGAGRAGGAFDLALLHAGWQTDLVGHARLVDETRRSADGVAESLRELDGVDLVLLCVPDAAVAGLARSIPATSSVVVAHCSGSLMLDVLEPAPRRASIHPLVPLADPMRGSQLLRGAYFAVAGDPLGEQVVHSLAGTPVQVPESQRALHHAAAVIASNHVVALLAQVESIAATIGVPADAYLQLTRMAVDNVAELGAAAALTGPVSRGDWATVAAHLDALPEQERAAYRALAERAAVLAGGEPGDVQKAPTPHPAGE